MKLSDEDERETNLKVWQGLSLTLKLFTCIPSFLPSFLPSCIHSYNASLLGEQQSSPIPTILWLFSQSNSTLQHCWNSFSTILCLISTLVSMETILMEQMFLYLILLIELLRLSATFECDFRDYLYQQLTFFSWF